MPKYNIIELKDSWVVNGKYQIYKDGVIYYHWDYIGNHKDFPQYVFKLRDKLLKEEK